MLNRGLGLGPDSYRDGGSCFRVTALQSQRVTRFQNSVTFFTFHYSNESRIEIVTY